VQNSTDQQMSLNRCSERSGQSTYLAKPGQQQVGYGPKHQAEIQTHHFTLASTHSLFPRVQWAVTYVMVVTLT